MSTSKTFSSLENDMKLKWIVVVGGMCRVGDYPRPVPVPTLLWTRTPIAYCHLASEYSGAEARYPVTEINHAEAVEIATRFGGRLPRSAEWEWMAVGPQRLRWPWGNDPWRPEYANLREAGVDAVTPVDSHPDGATPDGLLDVAGNVWEWTLHSTPGNGFVIRGGSYSTPVAQAQFPIVNAAPAELRSRGIGLRVVREV
jgi:formylglycine-generating enzyme